MQFIKSTLLNNFSNLKHAFTTREGGVSLKPYDSLNLAWHVGDTSWHIETNHDLLAKELGYEKNSLVHMKQIHSTRVHRVQEEDTFFTPRSCDALITNQKNTPLMVMVADCSPILFYDDLQKVIAVAHAGRAGAFGNILKNVIDSFAHDFKSKTENISVAIGPSIGVCCYEVGAEIFEEASELGVAYAMQLRQNAYYLDIAKILHTQLLACGVKQERIEIMQECSCCTNRTFFSYRAEGVTGRFAGVLMME